MTATKTYDMAVVGAGVFGAWIALHLAKRGQRVLLLDAYGPGHSRSSSGDESRIIRMGYGADEIYTQWSQRSLVQWKELFAATAKQELFQKTGVLWLAESGNAQLQATVDALRRNQVEFELAAIAEPYGSGTFEYVTSGAGEQFSAKEFVFACGAWLAKLFPELLGDKIFPTRQTVFYFGIPAGDDRFSSPALPTWLIKNDECYGMPDLESRGLKIALDQHGERIDPDTQSRVVTATEAEEIRRLVAYRFPVLAHAPIVETRVCQYENTWNGDFLIDRHPTLSNVWLAGGGSGHGFKHGPAVGEYLAGQIVDGAKP